MKIKENVATFTIIFLDEFSENSEESSHTLTGQKPGQKGDVCDLWIELLSGITIIICDFTFFPL